MAYAKRTIRLNNAQRDYLQGFITKGVSVGSIAIFGISSIPIFRIEKDMVFPPFGKRYFLNVSEFSAF